MRPKGSKNPIYYRTCKVCKKDYTSGQIRSKFCSNACKCKHYYPETSQKKHKFQCIVSNIKQRDRESEVTLQVMEALFTKQNGLCAITGFPMTSIRGIGIGLQKENMYNVSVDRIDQSKGYTLGNVRLVCYQANMMRSILSDKELIFWCGSIKTNLTKEANRKKREAKK